MNFIKLVATIVVAYLAIPAGFSNAQDIKDRSIKLAFANAQDSAHDLESGSEFMRGVPVGGSGA